MNVSFPPLRRQTYDVDFIVAVYKGDKIVSKPHITMRLNGAVIQGNIELR